MNLTPEQKAENLECLKVLMDGGEVEHQGHTGEWWKVRDPSRLGNTPHRRIRVPREVPWSKPEHVPGPVCWLRFGSINQWDAMICSILPVGVVVVRRDDSFFRAWEDLQHGVIHSDDRINWKPCTAIEP